MNCGSMHPVITYVGSTAGERLKLLPHSGFPKQLLVLYKNGSLLQEEGAEDIVIATGLQRSVRIPYSAPLWSWD